MREKIDSGIWARSQRCVCEAAFAPAECGQSAGWSDNMDICHKSRNATGWDEVDRCSSGLLEILKV